MINLGAYAALVPEIPVAPSGSGAAVTNGSRKYFVYSVVGGSDYSLTSNVPVKIMTIALNGSNNTGTGSFSIDNDAFTDANNFSY